MLNRYCTGIHIFKIWFTDIYLFYATNVILIETTHMMPINTGHKQVPNPDPGVPPCPLHYNIFPVSNLLDSNNQLLKNSHSCSPVLGLGPCGLIHIISYCEDISIVLSLISTEVTSIPHPEQTGNQGQGCWMDLRLKDNMLYKVW